MRLNSVLKNPNLLKIVPLIGIGCSVAVMLILPSIRTAIDKISASYTADLAFAPSSVQMSSNQVVPVDLRINPNGARVGFAKTVVFFNPSLFKLNTEIDISSAPLKQVIKITPMSEANVTGRAEIVLGLRPTEKNTPLTSTSTIARLSFMPATAGSNQGQLNFVNSEMQIVDMDGTVIQSNASQALVTINPTTATPVPTAPSSPTATPVAPFSPTPRPTTPPQSTLQPTVSPTPRASITPQPTFSPTPRPSMSPIASPTLGVPVQGNGLIAQYYSDTQLSKLVLQRVDTWVNFNWLFGRPTKLVGRENFSARWSGKVRTTAAGQYTFFTRSDDGVRLRVNTAVLIDDWNIHGLKENAATIDLPANAMVDITLEYFESTGVAEVHLLWQPPSGRKTIIPSNSLFVQ